MKNYRITISLFISLSLIAIGCNKNSKNPTKPELTLSKSMVKIGEPLVAATNGLTAGSAVKFSAVGNGSSWLSSSGDSATYIFTSSGTYQISATFLSAPNGPAYDSSYSSVTVSDSLYNDSGYAHCDIVLSLPIASGDQINLTPISFSDSAGLVFLATTSNMYSAFPSLATGGNFVGVAGVFECDFNAVIEYPCNGPSYPTPATTDVFFSSVNNGTYALVIKLNGTTYTGSMLVTDVSCTFNWNYNAGVTISPLQIQKL